MKKKFKIFISLTFFLLIFFNIQTRSYSAESKEVGCRAFKKELKLFNDLDYLPSNLGGIFGFNLKQHFDDEKNEWIYTKSKNGNFLVGKVDSIELASKIKTGYEVVSLNDTKFILSDKQNNIISERKDIKFGFYDPKKGNFHLNLSN